MARSASPGGDPPEPPGAVEPAWHRRLLAGLRPSAPWPAVLARGTTPRTPRCGLRRGGGPDPRRRGGGPEPPGREVAPLATRLSAHGLFLTQGWFHGVP